MTRGYATDEDCGCLLLPSITRGSAHILPAWGETKVNTGGWEVDWGRTLVEHASPQLTTSPGKHVDAWTHITTIVLFHFDLIWEQVLIILLRLVSNWQSYCLGILRAETLGVCHYTKPRQSLLDYTSLFAAL